MVTNPRSSPETVACKTWFSGLVAMGANIVVAEIADYEVRRELIRSSRLAGLARLDWMKSTFTYAPLTTATMLRAASFWAAARSAGRPTADDSALDADVILAAQADLLSRSGAVIVATTNPRHLTLFCDARHRRAVP
jgi:predicted nucleic acid-binding protein